MEKKSKSNYTKKEKRQAKHIEESYEKKGLPEKKSKQYAWATINKHHGENKK